MSGWNYLHRLEYWRELSKYDRVHVFTEIAEDHGFCFHRKGVTRAAWYEHYTRLCALDFLDRKHAEPGVYLVTTLRDLPEVRKSLCTVRIQWPPPPRGR